MNIPIIFENEELLVVDKPAGLMVHPNGHSEETTLVDWFLEHAPEAKGVGEEQLSQSGENLERSGVVHRLDKDTSGVLLLAKTPEAFTHLKAQFQERLVTKEYHAVVYGHMKEKWGTIDRQIGKSARDFRLRSAQHGAKGTLRDAVTDWECVHNGTYKDEPFAYIKALPKTGRTHQIRVHLQAIGRCIVGDTLYAKSEMARSNNLDLERLALHAYSLKIVLSSGEEKEFIAMLPKELEEAVGRIG